MNRTTFLIAALAAVVLFLAAYANSLDNAFHFDDSHVIESNVYIRSLHNVPLFFKDAHTFSSLPQNSTYRPLVTLSLALDYAWGHGLAPRMFHVTQIVLMLITGALLVLFFAPMTGRDVALFCATLFCVHTANTETMNLISARSELISTIGLLMAFILYQRSEVARRTLLYLIPLAIGALAKAPLVVFSPLLFVYVLLFERQEDSNRAGRPIAAAGTAALPSLIVGILLLVFLNSMNAPEWASGGGSRYHYLITQPFIWLHYFRLFFLPIGLTADTDMTTFDHWYDTRAVAGYAFVALLVWWIVRSWRRDDSKPIAFGLSWFAIALIPTSIFPLAEVANEHRIFFAYIGLVLAVVWFAMRYWSRQLATLGAIVLIAHAVGTHSRNTTWRTEESLWSDVVAKSPANGRAWMNFGLTQMGKGQYAAAKESFEHAAKFVPTYWVLEINEGIDEGELGDQVAAEKHFRRALELNATDHSAHFFYARWLLKQGRGPEALPHLREAVRLSSGFAAARTMLLQVDFAIGAPEFRALDAETRRIDPSLIAVPHYATRDAALKAGLAAQKRNDWLGAADAFREADAADDLRASLAKLGF